MKLKKQSDATYPLIFLMVDSTDHVSGKTGLSPTVTISKNGGSFASPSGAVTEIGNGLYKVAGNATDSNTLGELWVHATATGADPADVQYLIVAYDPHDAVRLGLTALPNAAAAANGGLPTVDANNAVKVQSGTGANQLSISSGVVASNITQIDGLATSGNNATLNLKKLNIVNNAGDALVATSSGSNGNGANFTGNGTGNGIKTHSDSGAGLLASTVGSNAFKLDGGTGGHGLRVLGGTTGSSAASFEAQGTVGTCAGILVQGSNNTPGIYSLGNGTGAGIRADGGATGDGLELNGGSTSGKGIDANGTGGAADIEGDITGDLSGSIGSLGTGAIEGDTFHPDALIAIRNAFLVANVTLNSPTTTTNSVTLGGSYVANDDALNGLLLSHFDQTNQLIGTYTVIDYDNSTFTVTVDRPWIVTPVDTDMIRIYESAQGVARVNIRKGLAFDNFPFRMYDSTTHAPQSGATVTAQISKDGGSYAACANSVTDVGSGKYRINLTATETNAAVFSLKFTATGYDQQDIDVVTQE